MSAMVGMDVDQTRQLAAAFTRQAGRLHEIGATLDGLVRQMRWDGPDAEQLRSVWSSSARRQLAEAGAALHDAGALLQREAEAQEQASGGAGGAGAASGGAGGSWISSAGSLFGRFTGSLDSSGYTALTAVLGLGTTIGTVTKQGHYSALYKTFTGGADFFKYRRSPWLSSGPLMQALDHAPVMNALDKFNKGVSGISAAMSVQHAFFSGEPVDTGERISAAGGAAATALKMSKNPVLYLGGVATASVTEAAAAATQVDWSAEGRQQVWDAVTQDPGMVLEELGKATTQVITDKIWKVLG